MEMTKRNDFMPVMLDGDMSLQIPELDFGADPISKFFYNLSLNQTKKAEATKEEIYKSKAVQENRALAMMEGRLLFGDRMRDSQQQIIDAAELRRTEIDIRKEQLEQERVKTFMMKYEAKSAEIDFEVRGINLKKIKMEAGDGPA